MSEQMLDAQAWALAEVYKQQETERKDLVRYQLDATLILYKLYLDWAGLKEKHDGTLEQDPDKFALMNEKGARLTIAFMDPIVSHIISLSNYQDSQIASLNRSFADAMTSFLCRHKKEFEIVSYQAIRSIVMICLRLDNATLNKAYNAGERDSLRKSFTFSESKEQVSDNKRAFPFPYLPK